MDGLNSENEGTVFSSLGMQNTPVRTSSVIPAQEVVAKPYFFPPSSRTGIVRDQCHKEVNLSTRVIRAVRLPSMAHGSYTVPVQDDGVECI